MTKSDIIPTSMTGAKLRKNLFIEYIIHFYKRSLRKSSKNKIKSSFTDNVMICTAVDRNNHIFIFVGKVGTTILSSEEVETIYKPHLENVTCISSDRCPSYRLLVTNLNVELHSFKADSKEKRGIYHINHVNYIHKAIADYFHLHHGISSKYLNEYLALIAYKCMNKLLDVEFGLIEIAKCNCTARWKNYVHRPNVV